MLFGGEPPAESRNAAAAIPPGLAGVDVAAPSGIDEMLEGLHRVLEAVDHPHLHDFPAAGIAGRDNRVGLGGVQGHRLFEEDVLARPQGGNRMLGMKFVGCANDDRRDVAGRPRVRGSRRRSWLMLNWFLCLGQGRGTDVRHCRKVKAKLLATFGMGAIDVAEANETNCKGHVFPVG